MKAHDLIHGGLYLIGDSQIVRFYALNGCFYILDGDFFGSPFADADSGEIECFTINKNWLKISPIPLTAEILEKNGFIGDEAKNYKFYEYVWVKYDMDLSYPPVVTIKNSQCYFINQISYVHELQRALRVCGLDHLADGFKV